MNRIPIRHLAALLGACMAGGAAHDVLAQEALSRLDRLWSHATLHEGGSDSAVQSIVLSGRFQIDQANVETNGEDFSDTDLRRLRFGVKTQFLDDFTFHAEADFDPGGGDLGYARLTDTYLEWSPSDALAVTVGKQGAAFTLDGHTSSKELLTIDRSNLSNNIWFTEEYMPGVTVGGEKSGIVYNVGVFSSGERGRGFGRSNGGEFVLATVGRDFSERLDAREALLRLDVVDNEPDPNNSFTRPLERVTSLNFSFDAGPWGVRSDLSTARGYLGQSDLWGVMVMPYFSLAPELELVTRYTYLESNDPNGLRFARYESQVESGRGNEYSEAYVGLNYYLHGHKLKVQTGLQYADMEDTAADGGAHTGWAWTTGFRLSW